MLAIANTDQAHAWNGYEGRHWAAHQDRWDAVNRSANDSLFGAAAIDPAATGELMITGGDPLVAEVDPDDREEPGKPCGAE